MAAGEVARAAEFSAAVGVMDTGVSRITLGYRVSIAMLSDDTPACLDLAERANGAIVLGHGYAAAAAMLAGDPGSAADRWRRFCDDLKRRWHGPLPPDPLDWFLAATPLRPGPRLDGLVQALRAIA